MMKNIKLSFRATIMSILLTIVILSIGALGYTSYVNARFAADDFSTQILKKTSELVDAQINRLLISANEQGKLNLRLLNAYQFDVHDFPRLARYWLEVMRVRRLTGLSIGIEDTGEWFFVHRLPSGVLVVGDRRLDKETGRFLVKEYRPEDYPTGPFTIGHDRDQEDPRLQGWYIKAKAEKRQAWSETYVFHEAEGAEDVPGVSCGTPIHDKNDKLLGVLTSSFDVHELCAYLQGLKISDQGYAFVVEFRADQTRRVIAHPDPKILLRSKTDGGEGLVAPEQLSDRRVSAFLDAIPAGVSPSSLDGMTRIRFVRDGVKYLGAYHCLTSRETPDWLICVVIPEAEVFGRVEWSNRVHFGIGFAVLAIATAISLFVSAQVARPLERLARETESIGRFQVEAHPVEHSIVVEVDRLAKATEETKTNLRSFQRYVPGDLVRLLLATGQEAKPGVERRRMTISFCDLANFTSLSEAVSPEELVETLGDYFGTLSAQIVATGGTVDKYIGDAIMAFWGAPAPSTGHATSACLTALRCQEAMHEMRRRWSTDGKIPLHARIGMATGEVLVGNIGSPARLNYTVMGDTVNLSSRLEGLGKHYGVEILIAESTYLDAQAAVAARPVDRVSVKGRTQCCLVYELLGERGNLLPGTEDVVDLATRAFHLYEARDWSAAVRLSEQILRLRPDDGPARILIERCRGFTDAPPADDWDGVHRMLTK